MTIETVENYPFAQIGTRGEFEGTSDRHWCVKVGNELIGSFGDRGDIMGRDGSVGTLADLIFHPVNWDFLSRKLHEALDSGDGILAVRIALGLGEYHGFINGTNEAVCSVRELKDVGIPSKLRKYANFLPDNIPSVYAQLNAPHMSKRLGVWRSKQPVIRFDECIPENEKTN